ncbi:MFS transporter [Rhodococcus sp. MSC1_016]|uniref:MFS transporter n=1 Tax=Rhodococcus sp. MSC1_016 TaxID=2909266 RepID=UPI00202FBEE1|nr:MULTISPECIES: MFS transporter [Rhodococcus]GLK33350.1 MFS transporter [Rhodococcus wratislaviensis]
MADQLVPSKSVGGVATSRGPLWPLLASLLPATTAMYCLYQAIQTVLIPAQVEAIDPANKVGNLALLTTMTAVATLLALPLGGAISDRTSGRFGRRSPWLAVTAVLSALLTALMGSLDTVLLLGFVYALVFFASNFYQAALTAILPDRVPESRRGIASSVLGLGTPLGILVGVNFAARVQPELAYIGIGVFLVAATMVLLVVSPEGPYERRPRTMREGGKGARLSVASEFFGAFTSRNFTLAFASRFLLFLSYFVISGYLFYTLQDHIGVENLPGHSPAIAVATVSTIQTFAWILVAGIAGFLADKLDRRKLFVAVCSVGMGLAMLVPILVPTWSGMLVYAVLSGAFFGTYMSVDLALMSLVLPDGESEGRDMGILAVATAAPTLFSSAIAGALITYAGGYVTLFAFGSVVAIVAGIAVVPIRGIK